MLTASDLLASSTIAHPALCQVVLLGADGQQHCLSRYWAEWDQPRPESYRWACAVRGWHVCSTGAAPLRVRAVGVLRG